MKPIKTLLAAAICLTWTPFATAAPADVVLHQGPDSVMTQGEDGVIHCTFVEKPVAEVEDGVDPLPWYTHAVMTNNTLAFDLYKDLVGEADERANLFFSPISITAALSLTYEGAAGNTQTQFEEVLHVNEGIKRPGYHASLSELLGEFDGEDKPYTLTLANSLWGERSMPFRDAFLETLDKHYDAGFQAVDFMNNPEAQRERINGWVEEQTNKKIVDLLPEGSITGLTRLVLANAIYFNASWQYPFLEGMTKEKNFLVGPRGADVSIPRPILAQMMLLPNKRLRYADLDGLTALELPYKGGDLSMLVLLPDEFGGLPAIEAKLSPKTLAGWAEKLKPTHVRVELPKWEMRISTPLNDPLKRLGLTDAFDFERADFSRLSDSRTDGLAITDVVHQAFIRVDENGTEAAAATAIAIGGRSLPPKPVHFTADQPFLYVIRHNQTGAVLFIGRVIDPSAK